MITSEQYVEQGMFLVRGMTSQISMRVILELLRIQGEAPSFTSDGLLELGAFEGRVTLLLGLEARPGEDVIGVDTFSWPCHHTLDTFKKNVARFGPFVSNLRPLKADTHDEDLKENLLKHRFRFIHVDAGHEAIDLESDLELATRCLANTGLLVIDDMCHPEFPALTQVALNFIDRSPELELFAIIDREDFIGAAKFVVTTKGHGKDYDDQLRERLPKLVYPNNAKLPGRECLLLSNNYRIVPM